MAKYEIHDFYCMSCGNRLPLARRTNKLREPFHRKKLYCPFCGTEANMVEVKNYKEKLKFQEMFNNGEFEEELKASIEVVQNGVI